MLGLWFESARAMLFLFILLNALPVPMLRQVYLMALKAWQALCFRDIRRKTGSPVRGSVQASFRDTFRAAFWELFGFFLDPFGSLGASFGRLLANFRRFGGSFSHVCRVLGLFGRFGEDLRGFCTVSEEIFDIS